MSKIFIVMGKSATGKDTIFKEIMKRLHEQLNTVVLYTTRPIRTGETEGIEYHFVTREERDSLKEQGKIIEERVYHTVLGDWFYFTADDGQIDIYTLQNLEKGFKRYQSEGGNSWAKDVMGQIRKFKIVTLFDKQIVDEDTVQNFISGESDVHKE